MVKIKERRIALLLRKEGKSYSQIKKQLHLSKSTLSRWLGKYPLSKERISELRDNNQQRIESFRNTMFKKKENKMLGYYKEQQKKLLPLTNRELFFAGLFLYWGEGNKATPSVVSINNTDPEVLKFTLFWFIKSLQIPKNKIKAFLHLYRDMNVHEQMNFWSKTLNLSLDHFDKPFIKKTRRTDLDQKGFGHGTCGLRVSNTIIKNKILMGIKAVSDLYGEKAVKI